MYYCKPVYKHTWPESDVHVHVHALTSVALPLREGGGPTLHMKGDKDSTVEMGVKECHSTNG